MSGAEYKRGIEFIKRTAGCPAERKIRLDYWKKHARKLIGVKIPDEVIL